MILTCYKYSINFLFTNASIGYYSINHTRMPNIGKVAPCIAKQIPKPAALTIQRITKVHFKPEAIGCHLNIWLNIAQTRLTNAHQQNTRNVHYNSR